MVATHLMNAVHWCHHLVQRLLEAPRQRRALRELEQMDLSALEDIGLSRSELVGRCFGQKNGQCADF
ncbi:MAG: DUF1127 domain-containing protein [Pseudomonadota bacterium]